MPWVWRWFVIALLVLQFIFLAQLLFSNVSGNLAKVSYRREQRLAAIKAFENDPSPQNKTAMQDEFRLAAQYVGRRHLMFVGEVAAAVLIPEAILIYVWKRRERAVGQSAKQ